MDCAEVGFRRTAFLIGCGGPARKFVSVLAIRIFRRFGSVKAESGAVRHIVIGLQRHGPVLALPGNIIFSHCLAEGSVEDRISLDSTKIGLFRAAFGVLRLSPARECERVLSRRIFFRIRTVKAEGSAVRNIFVSFQRLCPILAHPGNTVFTQRLTEGGIENRIALDRSEICLFCAAFLIGYIGPAREGISVLCRRVSGRFRTVKAEVGSVLGICIGLQRLCPVLAHPGDFVFSHSLAESGIEDRISFDCTETFFRGAAFLIGFFSPTRKGIDVLRSRGFRRSRTAIAEVCTVINIRIGFQYLGPVLAHPGDLVFIHGLAESGVQSLFPRYLAEIGFRSTAFLTGFFSPAREGEGVLCCPLFLRIGTVKAENRPIDNIFIGFQSFGPILVHPGDRVRPLYDLPGSECCAGVISLTSDRHGIGILIRSAELAFLNIDLIIVFIQRHTIQDNTDQGHAVLLFVIINFLRGKGHYSVADIFRNDCHRGDNADGL